MQEKVSESDISLELKLKFNVLRSLISIFLF